MTAINYRQYSQYSLGEMDIQGITIHNTNNEYSAKENLDILKKTAQTISVHFFVDENGVERALPLTQSAMHTGKGFDNGNFNTIAIEICRSTCSWDLYKKAQDNAVVLIKDLMNKYGLNLEDIYFHIDFDTTKYCPHRILDKYESKENFIREELI